MKGACEEDIGGCKNLVELNKANLNAIVKVIELDWESIRSSPRDGSSTSYRLTKGTLHCWTVHQWVLVGGWIIMSAPVPFGVFWGVGTGLDWGPLLHV